jgi:hypothetical protein
LLSFTIPKFIIFINNSDEDIQKQIERGNILVVEPGIYFLTEQCRLIALSNMEVEDEG